MTEPSAATQSDLRKAYGEESPVLEVLFESIVYDFFWTTMQIGSLGCLIQARTKSDAGWTLRAYRHILDENSQAVILGLRFAEEMRIPAPAKDAIEGVYHGFEKAKQTSGALIRCATPFTAHQRGLVAKLADDWRALARKAMEALRLAEPMVKQRMTMQHAKNCQIIVDFLREVAHGDTRRVNEIGEISLPDLPERRRAPRVAASQPCKIMINGSAIDATLKDVSRFGLGVVCSHPLSLDELVTVELGDGRRLAATVKRRFGDEAGLKLLVPLDFTDALLVKGQG